MNDRADDNGLRQIIQRDIPPRVTRYLTVAALSAVGFGLGAGGLAIWDVLWEWPQLRDKVSANTAAITKLAENIERRPSPESLSRCGERIAVLESARAIDDREVQNIWNAINEQRRMRHD